MTKARTAAHADHTLLSLRNPRQRHAHRGSRRKDDPAMFSQDFAVIRAVHAVHAGQSYLPAAVAATLAEMATRPDLSAREVEVLSLIARGLGNKRIAFELGIAEHTVKNHVKNILNKLSVDDRTQATTVALQRGKAGMPDSFDHRKALVPSTWQI